MDKRNIDYRIYVTKNPGNIQIDGHCPDNFSDLYEDFFSARVRICAVFIIQFGQ